MRYRGQRGVGTNVGAQEQDLLSDTQKQVSPATEAVLAALMPAGP